MGAKKATLVSQLRRFAQKLKKEFDPERVILFGSRAGREYLKESDVDLIIVSKRFEGVNFFERAAKMYRYWDLPYPVDFLCYTPDEFEAKRLAITIVREAVRKGIEIKK